MGAATLVILGAPLLALANPLSAFLNLLGMPADAAAAQPDSTNSQRMDLLQPAGNADPSQSDAPAIQADNSALAATVGPVGTGSDVVQAAASSQVSVYTVHSGDTLSGIAAMFGVSVNTILWANDIKNGVIHEGDQLVILPVNGIEHTVAKGETIASLAATYHADAQNIASYNGLPPDGSLAVGTQIMIPDGTLSAPIAPKATTPPAKNKGKKGSPAVHPHTVHGAPTSSFEPYLGGSGPALPGYFSWPVAGGQITQGLHGWNAVDIGASRGTPIYAAAAGTVIVARSGGWNGGYGSYVVVSHPNGTQTLYAHMSEVMASIGEQVSQGETLGLVGATGKATGAHLHFEVRGAANPFAN